MEKEKVYITRDEIENDIWIWRKPKKGNWSPHKEPDCEVISWQREDIDHADCYYIKDFKKKFGMIINKKARKCIHLSKKLLDSEDYKQFSNDIKRKK